MEQQAFDPGLTQSYEGTLRRIVNKDGSFNVHRRGTRLNDFHFYQFLIGLSWPQFIAVLFGTFVVVSAVFAALYLVVGISTLQGADTKTPLESFLSALFFSVQTLTTVGYGLIAPRTMGSDAISASRR